MPARSVLKSSIADRIKGPVAWSFRILDDEQIDLVIELCRQTVRDHGIRIDRVVGLATSRRRARMIPVPSFLEALRRCRIDFVARRCARRAKLPGYQQQLPDVKWFQERMQSHGFLVPQHGDPRPCDARCQIRGIPDEVSTGPLRRAAGSPKQLRWLTRWCSGGGKAGDAASTTGTGQRLRQRPRQ